MILLDDGWSAASSWDTRIKAADELIANADSDRRGVALVPLSEPTRDITLMPAGTARVALRQFAPKPYAIERVETLPAIDALPESDRRLPRSPGCPTASIPGAAPEFVEGLGKTHRRPHADDLRGRHAARRWRWSAPKMPRPR